MEEIACILVKHIDGSEVWEPRDAYMANPNRGTFIIREKPPRYEPVVRLCQLPDRE
jgi:hypothetical protein